MLWAERAYIHNCNMDLYILFRVARIESRYIKRDYKSLFTSGGNYIMQRIKVRRWIAWMLVFAMAFSGQLIPAQAKTILSKPKISRVVSKNAGELKITYKKMPKQTKHTPRERDKICLSFGEILSAASRK